MSVLNSFLGKILKNVLVGILNKEGLEGGGFVMFIKHFSHVAKLAKTLLMVIMFIYYKFFVVYKK